MEQEPEFVLPGKAICSINSNSKDGKIVPGSGTYLCYARTASSLVVPTIFASLGGIVKRTKTKIKRSANTNSNDNDNNTNKNVNTNTNSNINAPSKEDDNKQKNKQEEENDTEIITIISVERFGNLNNGINTVIKVGDTVICRVDRLNVHAKQLHVSVLAVVNSPTINESLIDDDNNNNNKNKNNDDQSNSKSLISKSRIMKGEYTGIIRSIDIRATERDSVIVDDCFRPGDIIRASVLSLGDGRDFYFSTARNDLGVILAVASSIGSQGSIMYPLNWNTMRCPVTNAIESRKVAAIA